ncbi:MAG: hypothetical protein JWO60_881 [Frankiales bacterium]|nr:hypothetical protein [Frankiales bacterium]
MVEEQERVEVALPSDLTAPGSARRAVRPLLHRWRLSGLLDPVLLAVSELVTNAVRYGRAPVRLSLRRCSGGVAVGVHDGAVVVPRAPGLPDDDAEGGRGLLLVEAVSDETGVRAEADGKVVWARFDTPTDQADD